MRKTVSLLLIISLFSAVSAGAQAKEADLAGSWYPASKERLIAQLNSYMDKAETVKIKGEIVGIIAPHAGLTFSGPVAAHSYKIIREMEVDTVVVIGFSHRKYYDGVAIFDGESYTTPLGIVEIDQNMTKELINQHEKIYSYPGAFEDENSVEMQIPFLQVVLENFKLVLIAIGEQDYENSQIIADALHNVLKNRNRFLLVASTDMCHFLTYDRANRVDGDTISIMEEFNPKKLYTESMLKSHQLMCGYGAVCATMLAAKALGADEIKILKYANSGDTFGDRGRVVGYLSAAIYRKNPKSEKKEKGMLSEEQKKKLLKIAKDTIDAYIKTGKKLKVKEDDPLLNREMGAFVTLHRNGQLRGCIGNIIGKGPLYLTVRDMAIESATGDPRFSPVTATELKNIDIEISVLSELEKVDDPNTIEMGKHGVLIRSGFRSGVFLPQVATETGWSREEFMSNLCSHKAGLSPDAWKTGKCEIFVFTAEVFGEK